ncbi:hypothetical protein FB45DRAFT_1075916 [Roridomyces roridus]|uniref:DUF6534 domain-containing protein n=1 Tax=Roridomyces roridus TaxID=1738132 RepID=A0AAD7CIJ2_9AGAR|nr:hypothetical protein FB45DRAFT_1075916 [Roridomyces roridus]
MSDPNIPKTLGALLIGGLFASLLGGTVNLQTVSYFRAYQKDRVSVKTLISVIWFLDNLHTAFIWASLWLCLIQNYGQEDLVDSIPWCIALTVMITAVVTFLVHCFFAHRIFLLSKKNWFITLPVLALTLLRLVAASVSTWEMLHYRSFTLFRIHGRWIFTLGLAVSSAVDILITVFLVYLFRSNRTESGRFNYIFDKLIRYGLETGSLTCLGTVVTMSCWVTQPQNLIFLGLHVVIGKLYATSLLVTLNYRVGMTMSRASCSQCDQRAPVLFLESRHQKTNSRGYLAGGPSRKIPTELQISVETRTSVQFDGKADSVMESAKQEDL